MTSITFEHVTKRFPGANAPAIADVSFDVPSGAICMLLGTSGSGKTTLLRMVNRLGDPTSGQVLIDGIPTVEQDAISLRRRVGYVIQQVGLLPHLTVAENVRIVPAIIGDRSPASHQRVDALLEQVGLPPDEYRARYPAQLSGGQAQRVGLARALAADPSLLLMDEPFGALDAITRHRMQDELLNIQRTMQKTLLFVTHDVDEAFKLGDHIAVLSEGRLEQVGSPVELLAAPATPFVSRLVGADNILRQFEYLPVTTALEPGIAPDALAERIPASETLLPAVLRMMRSGQSTLAVEADGEIRGVVTLAGISRSVRARGGDISESGHL
ncbi:MAG TPA: ABC transporter ATP-binding protein [Thermomicrobiales bacterium]|nr:ABC transporter ATP-binding protein [Chloroflexota bacterium]HCG28196.1 ABC transporter ATP-binding protein [Chloroflexota bacterium]HQX62310.1 ABC transporter ATP-binding protein [Thermomicrobiales bacterium]HQZ89973.1 ABC transporter ATP-binding protein [Thermomicrobiales bacterium]HRA30829.1 ABC transporter ATP-binding protein [Thermomicrobiales bacterium]